MLLDVITEAFGHSSSPNAGDHRHIVARVALEPQQAPGAGACQFAGTVGNGNKHDSGQQARQSVPWMTVGNNHER